VNVWWSLIFLLSVLYNMLYVPYAIGFESEFKGAFIAIDILIVAITATDSVLRSKLASEK